MKNLISAKFVQNYALTNVTFQYIWKLTLIRNRINVIFVPRHLFLRLPLGNIRTHTGENPHKRRIFLKSFNTKCNFHLTLEYNILLENSHWRKIIQMWYLIKFIFLQICSYIIFAYGPCENSHWGKTTALWNLPKIIYS